MIGMEPFDARCGEREKGRTMKPLAISATTGLVGLLGLSMLGSCARAPHGGNAQAEDWPVCSRDQLLGPRPDPDEIRAHRLAGLPVLRYPFGTQRDGWGLQLTVRVDETGRVVCHSGKDELGRAQPLGEMQRVALGALQYRPFIRDGRPVAAVVTEHVDEEELPERQVPMPRVPLEAVSIGLRRSGCLGACPDYQVEIHGDGRVV